MKRSFLALPIFSVFLMTSANADPVTYFMEGSFSCLSCTAGDVSGLDGALFTLTIILDSIIFSKQMIFYHNRLKVNNNKFRTADMS